MAQTRSRRAADGSGDEEEQQTLNLDAPVAIQPFTMREFMAQSTARPPASKKVKPPMYESTADMREYLTLFEAIAAQNEWGPDESGLHLRCCLTGAPQRTAFQFRVLC